MEIGNKEIKLNKKSIIIFVIIIFIIAIIFILSRKFNIQNKLECIAIRNNETASIEEKITMLFEDDKLSKMIVYYKNAPTENFIFMLDDIYDNYDKQMSQLKNNGGYDYKIEVGDNYISSKSTIDVNKIPDETKAKIGFNNSWTYKDAKANLESHEFKCQ